jgi:GDPmannose 4,6-dehydratase
MAFNLVQVYRKSFGLFAANGVLFNHESPRRGETFVTRKVTRAVGRIKAGLQKELRLGNLGAQRDWGHARDYVEAMWLMLQYKEPRDWTVATGSAMPVSEWVRLSFKRAGLNMDDHVRQDDRYMRPNELHFLCGGYAETKALLGWEPKTSTYDLLNEMVDHDVRLAMAERAYDAAQIANAPILQPLPANNNASASR